MKWIKLYDSSSWWEKKLLNKEGYPTDEDVIDYFINKVDKGDIEVDKFRTQEELDREFYQSYEFTKKLIYFKNEEVDKWQKIKGLPGAWLLGRRDSEEIKALVYLKVSIPHPEGIRGNLYLDGYTIDILQSYLKKFVMRSGYNVNIIICIQDTNMVSNPLSESIVRIEFLNS